MIEIGSACTTLISSEDELSLEDETLLEKEALLEDDELATLLDELTLVATDDEDAEDEAELELEDSPKDVWLELMALLELAELLDEISLLEVSTLHAANKTRKMVKNANFFIKFSPYTCHVYDNQKNK